MRVTLIVFVLLLASCASTPVSLDSAISIPQDRLLSGYAQFATPRSEAVKITVVRDAGLAGSALAARLSVDAVDVADMRTSERADLYLLPGNHIFGVKSTPNYGSPLIEESYDIQPGNQYFFRISSDNGALSFQRSARIR